MNGPSNEHLKGFRLIPSTPEEDEAEMRRVRKAESASKRPHYPKGARLKAGGGCYPKSSAYHKERKNLRA